MKREIKFRAWNKKECQMFLSPKEIEHLGSWFDAHLPGSLAKKDNIVLMQYTGLKDSAGVEIYEGDVVRLANHPRQVEADHMEGVGVVKWKEDECSFAALRDKFTYMSMTWGGTESIKVIGNIHENPELIAV